MSVHMDKFQHSPPYWRLQVRWLQNPEFVRYVEEKIDIYFQINTNQTNACIRWEAFKAYIRGKLLVSQALKIRNEKQKLII